MHRRLRVAAATAAFVVAGAAAALAADRLAIVAIGTPGGPALTTAAAGVSVWQVTAGSVNYGTFTQLPTSATETNVPVTLSGTDIDEGHLTALPDGGGVRGDGDVHAVHDRAVARAGGGTSGNAPTFAW